jgi:hypothetical protein
MWWLYDISSVFVRERNQIFSCSKWENEKKFAHTHRDRNHWDDAEIYISSWQFKSLREKSFVIDSLRLVTLMQIA